MYFLLLKGNTEVEEQLDVSNAAGVEETHEEVIHLLFTLKVKKCVFVNMLISNNFPLHYKFWLL